MQYPIDVSKDLLLIYNTNSADDSNVCAYYLANRPMVSNANVLGIGCTNIETIVPSDMTNIEAQITNWLFLNPTKRPSYLVLFQDIPSRVNTITDPSQNYNGTGGTFYPSVQYQLRYWTAKNWYPFVTSINMNGSNSAAPYNSPYNLNTNYPTNLFSSDGTNDCIAYINKLTNFGNTGSNVGQLVISGIAAGYGNTNWYFDDSVVGYVAPGPGGLGYQAAQMVSATDPFASIFYSYNTNFTKGTNVAGFYSLGYHGNFDPTYAIDGTNVFLGNSGWYIIDTDESFNGERYESGQGNFLEWFSTAAFEGSSYSNTPVGAGSNVDEPGTTSCDPALFFGYWAAGKNFAYCACNSSAGARWVQVIGDPFTKW